MPSTKIVHIARFTVHKGNVVCSLEAGVARCDIRSHLWRTPKKPSGCSSTDWARGLQVSGHQEAEFVCSQQTLFGGKPPEVRPGYDDIDNGVVCQVRSFGVDCFVQHWHGFMLSRTGYVFF